jgi:hypothetical protein
MTLVGIYIAGLQPSLDMNMRPIEGRRFVVSHALKGDDQS